jgi:hypothetical protein
MTFTIYIYYDTKNKASAERKAKKYKEYVIKHEENCIILEKKL